MHSLQDLLKQPSCTIVDVRTEAEYEMEHFPGAVLIPLHTIPNALEDIKAMSKPIVVYCRSGNRSSQAVDFLRQHQISEVYDGGGLSDMLMAKN